jgi:hypothetical protein
MNNMAYFAELDTNNIVIRVVVVDNEYDTEDGSDWCEEFFGGGTWVRTARDSSIRANYAGVGFHYDTQLDAFIPPKPYDSWSLDEGTCRWEAPVPYPEDADPTLPYMWDEDNIQWVLEEPLELEA